MEEDETMAIFNARHSKSSLLAGEEIFKYEDCHKSPKIIAKFV